MQYTWRDIDDDKYRMWRMNRVPFAMPRYAMEELNRLYQNKEKLKPTSLRQIMIEVVGGEEFYNEDFCTGVDLNRNFPYMWGVCHF